MLLHALSAVQSAEAYGNFLMIEMQESIYQSLAAADHINLGPGTNKSNQAFSIHALTGDYRRIVHKPEGLHWRVLEYSDPDEPLALSELERLSSMKEPTALQGMSQLLRRRGSLFCWVSHGSLCPVCHEDWEGKK